MSARLATEADLPECKRMAFAFIEAAKQDADGDSVETTLRSLLDTEGLYVAGDPLHAMAGVLVYENYMKRSQKVAQELFWWVDKPARGNGAGLSLLRALEDHARSHGASALSMISLDAVDGERVAKLYEANGYQPLERSFRKVMHGN